WHLDANRRPGLADLPAKPFRVLAGDGSVSSGYSYFSFLADRRCRSRPRRTQENPPRLAICADGLRHDTNRAGGDGPNPRMAYALPLVRFRIGPSLRRTRVLGADSFSRRQGGYAKRHCAEFDTVQYGGNDWPRAGRAS